MTTKHFINEPKSVVLDSLKGLVYANPSLALDVEQRVVYRSKIDSNKVHIITGGGSGHEPAHAGFVGSGMLSAAVCGNTFASPNSRQVSSAIARTSNTKGTLVVVKNYTGDVLQFGLAKERYAATHPGKDDIRFLIVGDDVAVGREAGKITGRRGLSGTVLVYKCAGALAETGADLPQVFAVAEFVAKNTATIGVGVEHCHVPGSSVSDQSHLKSDEVEIGMGIHNESGAKTSKLGSVSSLVSELIKTLTATDDKDRSFVDFKNDGSDQVVLLVNNLGSVSELEMGVIVKEAGVALQNHKMQVKRVMVGTIMTSLNMPGFSLSLVRLPNEKISKDGQEISSDLILELLDAPAPVPGWKNFSSAEPNINILAEKSSPDDNNAGDTASSAGSGKGPAPTNENVFVKCIEAACKSVIAAEPDLTKYDQILGDGDCGETLKNGSAAVLSKIQDGKLSSTNVGDAMVAISEAVEEQMGGTSGGLFSIFFNALAGAFYQSESKTASSAVWAKCLESALNQLYNYTRARPPSRTLVDPLGAFIVTYGLDSSDFEAAFEEAKAATEATKTQEAKAGRAAYVEAKKVMESGVPDAGAYGVLKFLEGIRAEIRK